MDYRQILDNLITFGACSWHPSLNKKYIDQFKPAIDSFFQKRGELTDKNKWALHYNIYHGIINKNHKMTNIDNIDDLDSIKNKIINGGYTVYYKDSKFKYHAGNPVSIFEILLHSFEEEPIYKYWHLSEFQKTLAISERIEKDYQKRSGMRGYTFHSISDDDLHLIAIDIQGILRKEGLAIVR